MKHGSWDYKGHEELGIEFTFDTAQTDWNATLLTAINRAYGDDFEKSKNVFIAKKFMPIIETICIYDPPTKTIGNTVFIPIDLETPKLYIVAPHIIQFMGIEHGDYASVVIKNYDE